VILFGNTVAFLIKVGTLRRILHQRLQLSSKKIRALRFLL